MAGTPSPSSSMNSLKTISPASLNILRLRGNDPIAKDGFRAVSNTSYTSESSVDSEATVYIPDELGSIETLVFLEFTYDTAMVIWDAYLQDKLNRPHRAHILSQAKRHISRFPNPMRRDEDWYGAMSAMGLTKGCQARLMDQDFEHMRLASSLHETVHDVLEMRYEFLFGLDAAIQAPPEQTIYRKSSILNIDGSFTTIPAKSHPSQGSKAHPPSLSVSKTKAPTSQGPKMGLFKSPTAQQPQVANAAADPPREVEGCLMLFKGATMKRLEKVLRYDESLNFEALLSSGPTDFSRTVNGLFFTNQYAVAWEFAKWARQKAEGNVVPVGILHVAVPRQILQAAQEMVGDDWRRMVWACRRGDRLPEGLKHYNDYSWLIGSIMHNSSAQVEDMRDMTEMSVMKVAGKGGGTGETGTQHYTGQPGMISLLDRECVGKVWISPIATRMVKGDSV